LGKIWFPSRSWFCELIIVIVFGIWSHGVRWVLLPVNIHFHWNLFIFEFLTIYFTRCGCCSYQVSSISVRRVTCYDHFCVFQLFSILAVSMATAAILKIPKVMCTSTHST
jgi:hypothetical protein